MKQIIITIFVGALLTGCATPSDRRQNLPDLDLVSKKTAKQVALCIADRWENTKPFMAFTSPPINTSMKLDGYSITATNINHLGGTSTIILADVTEMQLESSTKYYKMSGGGFGAYDEAVIQCQ
jgi:hypothetical protein